MFDIVVAPPNIETVESGVVNNTIQSKGEPDTLQSSTTNENGIDAEQCSNATTEHPLVQTIQRATQLAFLPTKFKKLIWIKRNDFVIVECGDEEAEEIQQKFEKDSSSGGGGFRYAITHILYKDQVKHIKAKGLWPMDPFFAEDDQESYVSPMRESPTKSVKQNRYSTSDSYTKESEDDDSQEEAKNNGGMYEDNGIVFDDPLGNDLMLNTNRISTLRVDESSSEDDSD